MTRGEGDRVRERKTGDSVREEGQHFQKKDRGRKKRGRGERCSEHKGECEDWVNAGVYILAVEKE